MDVARSNPHVALLSRKADYALLILSYLHYHPEGGCAREIWERFGLKKAFTANVLKLLCRVFHFFVGTNSKLRI